MDNENFKWVVNDIYDNFFIKLFYKKDGSEIFCGTFDVMGIYKTTGDELNIRFANIKDIEEFLTIGIVRFVNIENDKDIIEIPIRNMYKLYKNGIRLGNKNTNNISINNLEDYSNFSILDGTIINKNYYVSSYIIDFDMSNNNDLEKILKIASRINDLGLHDRFIALSDANMINYNRVKENNNKYRK